MKRFFAITSAVLCSMLFLTAGCEKSSEQKESGAEAEQSVEFETEKGEKGDKGKFEFSGEIPPAPGDEDFEQKKGEPEQKFEEPEQKQTQKQMQKF